MWTPETPNWPVDAGPSTYTQPKQGIAALQLQAVPVAQALIPQYDQRQSLVQGQPVISHYLDPNTGQYLAKPTESTAAPSTPTLDVSKYNRFDGSYAGNPNISGEDRDEYGVPQRYNEYITNPDGSVKINYYDASGNFTGSKNYSSLIQNSGGDLFGGISDLIHNVGTAVAQTPILNTAAGAALIAAGVPAPAAVALLQANAGASPEQVLKSAAITGLIGGVAQGVGNEVAQNYGQTAGQVAGNAAGSLTGAVVTGKDPLTALENSLVNSGFNVGAKEVANEIPGYSDLPDAAKKAVNTAIVATIQGKDPTSALLNQAIKAGTTEAIDQARIAYNTNAIKNFVEEPQTTADVAQVTPEDANHQAILDTFNNVLGRDPTPEEYQKFAGDNAINVQTADTGFQTLSPEQIAAYTQPVNNIIENAGTGVQLAQAPTNVMSDAAGSFPVINGVIDLGEVTTNPQDTAEEPNYNVGQEEPEISAEPVSQQDVQKIVDEYLQPTQENINNIVYKEPAETTPTETSSEVAPTETAKTVPTQTTDSVPIETTPVKATPTTPQETSKVVEKEFPAETTPSNQQAYDQLTQGQKDLYNQIIDLGGTSQAALDAAVSGLGEQIGGVQSNVNDLNANLQATNNALNGRIDDLMQQGLDQYTATQLAQAEFEQATNQQFEDVNAQIADVAQQNNTNYGNLNTAIANQGTALTGALTKQGAALKNQLNNLRAQQAQTIEQPQSGGLPTMPKAVYLTSKGNKAKFISPLALAMDGGENTNMDTPYYNYGQAQSIDEVLNPTEVHAATGGLISPLMKEGGFAGTRHGKYAHGGLSKVVHHSGKARVDFRDGDAVSGPGDGQSDDIPAMLADGEWVWPADVVAALGNGSTKAGSDKLYEAMHAIRARARSTGPKDLPPPAYDSPLDYLKKRKK